MHVTKTTSFGKIIYCAIYNLKAAQQAANSAADAITFEGAFFRRDIGHRVEHLSVGS